jgi:hypothetical protein
MFAAASEMLFGATLSITNTNNAPSTISSEISLLVEWVTMVSLATAHSRLDKVVSTPRAFLLDDGGGESSDDESTGEGEL